MKKIIALAITLFILTIATASCAYALEPAFTTVKYDVVKYKETYEVSDTWYEVCRANGDDYKNSADPEPLCISVENGRYVVNYRDEDPSSCNRWAKLYLEKYEVEIILEETLEPRLQELSVTAWYRFCDTKEDAFTFDYAKYLLILPEDTIFE